MLAVRYVAALLIVLLVHSLGVWMVPEFARAIDLFVVLVVLTGLRADSFAGLAGGLVAGLAQDVLSAGLFGLHGFADTLVGYGSARLSQRLVIERPSGVLLVAAAGSIVQQAVLVGLAFALLPEGELPEPTWIGIRAASSGVIAMVVFAAGARWRSGSQARRLSRSKRLRLD